MAGQSLGLIETIGLGVAIEAADAAMKSANVELIGYELTKGGGLVTVKLTGDVGAINAAVSAGVAVANRVGGVYAWKVIARTASGIDALITSQETTGVTPPVVLSPDHSPQQNSKPEEIPVVNLEPVTSTGDCMALNEEMLTQSVNQLTGGETEPEQPEAADKPLTTEENKPPKPRHKSSKR